MFPVVRLLRASGPSLAGLALLFVVCAACGVGGAGGPLDEEVARFDFERESWVGFAQRTDDAAHGGRWSSRVDAGVTGGAAISPLIPCSGGDSVHVSWWVLLDGFVGSEVTLHMYLYSDAPSEHAAIPTLPVKLVAATLFRSERADEWADGSWRSGSATVRIEGRSVSPDWIRLEWRALQRGSEDGGQVLFDDVVVTCRSRG